MTEDERKALPQEGGAFEHAQEDELAIPEAPEGEGQSPVLGETERVEAHKGDERRMEEIEAQLQSSPEQDAQTTPALESPSSLTAERTKPAGVLQGLLRNRLDVNTLFARHILGPEASDTEVQDLARKTFDEYVNTFKFNARMMVTPNAREKIMDMTDIMGQENLDRALERSGRAVVVTSHMTYFPTAMRMIPSLLPERTRGTTLVEKNPFWPLVRFGQSINRLFQPKDDPARRYEMIVKESSNPRTSLSMIRRLKNGQSEGQREIIFMAADRGDLSPDRRRTRVQFLDSETNFPTGPATFARHADAPIVPTYILRDGDRFRLVLGEPIELPVDVPDDEADQIVMQRVADFFAEGIREKPEQWPVARNDYWPDQPEFKPAER